MALIWHGKKVQQAIALDIRQKILQSVMLIEANTKVLLGQAGGRTESGRAVLKPGTKTVRIDPVSGKKAGKINTYRSQPGEPPRKQSGHLGRSVASEIHPTLPIGRAGVTKSAPYGKFLEFGTRKMAPRPFLRPSLKKSLPDITIIMGRKIRGT